MKIINYIILMMIISSCTIVPLYRVRKVKLCEKKAYDTVCTGYEDDVEYIDSNSIYN